MNIPQNILSVKIGGEVYGFDGDKILQILRVPAITEIPLASSGIKGLSSIGGKVVTIVDMASVLCLDSIEDDNPKARLLTIDCDGELYGLLVDEVVGMSMVQEENYEPSLNSDDTIEAIYKQENSICQIINSCKAISTLSLASYRPVEIDRFEQKVQNTTDNLTTQDSSRYLFLILGDERFAISLDIAREIIFVPKEITPMSEADFGVMGMITLRDELIVSIDIKQLLDVNSTNSIEQKEQRLLILSYEGNSLALKVDSISEVKEIPLSKIEKLPQRFSNTKVESIYKADDFLVSIISKSYLIELLEEYCIEEHKTEEDDENLRSEDMIEAAVFQIANEEFALGIEDVQEIIRYTEVTPIPEAPQFIDGVINLRGVVIPIMSLPQRLGFEKKIDNKSKILVCIIGDERIGLLVDDVNEIMFIEDKYISKSSSEDTLFSDVITLDDGKRVILKINISNLIPQNILDSINIAQ